MSEILPSCLFAFACCRSRSRRRFLLQFAPIVIDRGPDESFQSTLIDLVVLMDIDRASRVAFEAGIEEA
jgi:hypothetical protein